MEIHSKVAWGGWHIRKGDTLVVKVDSKYSPEALPLVVYHEVREDYYMNTLGLSYSKAHDLANGDERIKFGPRAFFSELGETRNILAQNRGNKPIAKGRSRS